MNPMTIPLAILSWTAFLGLLHAISTGVQTVTQFGNDYAASPRDEQRPLSVKRGRNMRAFQNWLQTFPIFAVAVVISHLVLRDHGVASWGAQIYFWARLIYVPLYVSGSKLRTPIFFVSVLGILLVFLSFV